MANFRVRKHADFSASPTKGLAPLVVKFTDKSRGKITSRLWKFGDGRTSTRISPTHRYGKPGKYTVRLLVDGPGGPDEMVKRAYIKVTPE